MSLAPVGPGGSWASGVFIAQVLRGQGDKGTIGLAASPLAGEEQPAASTPEIPRGQEHFTF